MSRSDRTDERVEDLLRELAPRVLGALVRRFGHFDACEDAVQLALLAAATQWPAAGVPEHPRGWLQTVAARRLTDQLRGDSARRAREERVASANPRSDTVSPAADDSEDERGPLGGPGESEPDDVLTLLVLCCHPSLTPSSQIALTLRAVGGLTTAEIASAFMVPETTMGQRISRAKQTIRAGGARFEMPAGDELDERLVMVLHVLYLVFNEGYTTSGGHDVTRADLTAEAIRLTRCVHALRPGDGEVGGLLALMLLTDARRAARTGPGGVLIPLAEQDRSVWDGDAIHEGVAIVSHALATSRLGPYQLQAAIAAVHSEAPSSAETDWPQIVALYELLERIAPNPMTTLNRAVAVAMTSGAPAGLALLATLDGDERLTGHHRLAAVRGHLLELAGDMAGACDQYRLAARRTRSLPERRHLEGKLAAIRPDVES